jgi:hypothetical protein
VEHHQLFLRPAEGRRVAPAAALLLLLSAGWSPPGLHAQSVTSGRMPGEPAWLQIRVLAGEGAIHPARSRSTHPLVVQVIDEGNRPVQAAVVGFRLPEEGPGGSFVNGLKTELVTTSSEGKASLGGFQASELMGAFQIRVTAVKGKARAGIVISQHVAGGEPPGGSGARASVSPPKKASAPTPISASADASATAPPPQRSTAENTQRPPTGWSTEGSVAVPGSRKKWLLLVLGAGLAGGLVSGVVRGSPGGAAAAPGAPPLTEKPLVISPPTISIGKP